MSEQQPERPRPNPIIDEPATVEACQHDYAAGALARHDSEQRDLNASSGGAR